MSLGRKHCKPCKGEVRPLTADRRRKLAAEIDNWTMEEDRKLEKVLVFKNFKEALDFVNKVGKIAEAEDHHPDISIFNYRKVRIELSTHAVGGLSENDFILAAKIDELSRN